MAATQTVDSEEETMPSSPTFAVDQAKMAIADLLRVAQMWLPRIPQQTYTRQPVQEVYDFVSQCLQVMNEIEHLTSKQANDRADFIVEWFHTLQGPTNKLCMDPLAEDPKEDSNDPPISTNHHGTNVLCCFGLCFLIYYYFLLFMY